MRPNNAGGGSEMQVAMTGASGLVGTALRRHLEQAGHEVVPLVRNTSQTGIFWNPAEGRLDERGLAGLDALVHLAGENIAGQRWTPAFKAKIRESRTRGTSLLAHAIARLASPPRVFVSASAVGIFGDRGDELLNEESPPGIGFLAEVGKEWEEAAQRAAGATRLVITRLGVVLSRDGGALASMLTPFRLGLGAVIGSGRQYMSWISLPDTVSAFAHVLQSPDQGGTFHFVSPNPVTNRTFTQSLGRVLGRPTFLPLPAWGARLALGEMADGLLLASTRAVPSRLQKGGFAFAHPELELALRAALNEPAGANENRP